jgi:tetraacyldisaccharide 4'-kinase
MKYLRWLLFPFSLIYGLVVIIRNWFYDAGFFKSQRFTIPIISVGNLEVGGAGKSPMTEYLVRLFKNDHKLATLSRGYGRKTKGYLVKNQDFENQESRIKSQDIQRQDFENQESRVKSQELGFLDLKLQISEQIGDEPSQFHQKFPDITVAVCEDRVTGIRQLMQDHDLILMDDAYQHRAVTPGLSILLFDYNRVSEPHLLLPAGNFREPFSGRWRAQIIIVSKCPVTLSLEEKNALAYKIGPMPYQQLFFTAIDYQPLNDLEGKPANVLIDQDTTVFLLTGIANPRPLMQHLNSFTSHIIHHNYADHHPFTLKNITKLAAEYAACTSQKKIIVTTEKDAQRLDESWFKQGLPGVVSIPVFVMPISIEFLDGSGQSFDKIVTEYVREHTTNHSIH